MTIKKIVIDGQTYAVDDHRFNVMDSFARSQAVKDQILAGVGARDSQEALAFVISQLAYTESQLFEKQYQPMQYEQFLPISYEAGEWADTIRYEIYDYAGRGKRSTGRGREVNTVDVAYADKSFKVVHGDVGYEYSLAELRETAFLRRPINERKMVGAMEAFRRHMNDVGLFGEGSDFTGLYNNPDVPAGSAPTGGWMDPADVGLILADINYALTTVWTSTQFNDMPNTVLIPPEQYAYIASTPRSINSDKTILQYIRENNIAKVERNIDVTFAPGYGLDTAGSGDTTRMIAYVKSDQRLIMHIPMALRFLAPQLMGYQVQVPGEYKYSGVEIRYPKSAIYVDGV